MDRLRIALVGCGNVGRAFVRMLEGRRDLIRGTYGADPVITSVVTGHGGVVREDGIDAAALRAEDLDPAIDALSVIDAGAYDVLVELTPTNIRSGQPATDHIRHALSRGRHVVTANKGPVAWFYRELRDLAAEKGVAFLHESAVLSGAPVFNLSRETLIGCRVTAVRGIVNTTTNFVLSQMRDGASLDEALEVGRRQGFVEADPSLDLDGWDAAAKLCVLMNVLMDARITPPDIRRTGIRGVTAEDLAAARRSGGQVRLVCRGRFDEDGTPVGVVEPVVVEPGDVAHITEGTMSFVTLTTDLMGDISIIEHAHEPEIDHPAYGVFCDVLRILRSYR